MNDYSDKNNIYPPLPQHNENFRLYLAREILVKLQKEEDHYERVRKKYNKFTKIFQTLSIGTGSCSVFLSGFGIGTSLTGLFLIGLPLGAIGGSFGLFSVGTGIFSKKLNEKVSKHERISTLGEETIYIDHIQLLKLPSDQLQFSLFILSPHISYYSKENLAFV